MNNNEMLNGFNKNMNNCIQNKDYYSFYVLINRMRIEHGKMAQNVFNLLNCREERNNNFNIRVSLLMTNKCKLGDLIKNSEKLLSERMRECPADQMAKINNFSIDRDIDMQQDEQKTYSLLYFYLPNCVYCQKFNQVWNDLKSTNLNNIDFVKLNPLTKNEQAKQLINNLVNKLQVEGYPSIFLNDNSTDVGQNTVQYNGNRDMNSILDFLKKSTVNFNTTNNNFNTYKEKNNTNSFNERYMSSFNDEKNTHSFNKDTIEDYEIAHQAYNDKNYSNVNNKHRSYNDDTKENYRTFSAINDRSNNTGTGNMRQFYDAKIDLNEEDYDDEEFNNINDFNNNFERLNNKSFKNNQNEFKGNIQNENENKRFRVNIQDENLNFNK